jgi:repressor LexA
LLTLAKSQNLGALSLRHIASLIGAEGRPQVVKYHLRKLEEAGLIQLNLEAGVIKPVTQGTLRGVRGFFYSLPIVGSANCGPATVFADERIEGYLKVSSKMLPKKKDGLYVLVADGPSMNRAIVHGEDTIEHNDYVVVDSASCSPKNRDIVVAVIDGMATIKRYTEDRERNRIILESESTENYAPIYVHESDDFAISGTVVGVIKR